MMIHAITRLHPSTTLKRLIAAILGVALGYSVLLGLLYINQSRLAYVPLREMLATPAEHGYAYEDLWLATSDGEMLHAWYVPAPQARGTALYLYGNGGNMSAVLREIEGLHALQLDVFLLDWRGYGQSSGTPSEQGLYTDVQTAWDYLTQQRGIDPARIIIIGYSMGGGPGSWLAAQTTPAGIILLNTFTSFEAIGAQRYPLFPVRLLSHHRYPTQQHLAQITAPVLVVHAADDRTIPIEHGYALHATAHTPFPLLVTKGGHGTGMRASYQQYPAELDAFVRAALEQEPQRAQ